MKKCFECEETEDLQGHHIVPKCRGGTKIITLCYECHMKAHGRTGKGLDHKRLTKEGLVKAKERGIKLGSPSPKNGSKASVIKRKAAANEFALKIAPIIMNEHNNSEMARILNGSGIPTRLGRKWSPKTVRDMRKKIKIIKEKI